MLIDFSVEHQLGMFANLSDRNRLCLACSRQQTGNERLVRNGKCESALLT